MYIIRKLDDCDFDDFARIELAAYPAIGGTIAQAADRMKKQNEPDDVTFYGIFDTNCMVGGFILYSYTINIHNVMTGAMGIGSVAVDLCRKKEKVAREIMKFFIYEARQNNIPVALLYPFNPEFYKNMGFGFGTALSQFRLKPGALPVKSGKSHVRRLTEADAKMLAGFYNSRAEATNGMIQKNIGEFSDILKREQTRVFGCINDNKLTAYIITNFKKGEESFLVNDMVVSEILFENREGLYELLAFLNSQNDQLRSIIINTFDEDFAYLLNDPRNQSQKLMYSVYHECYHKGIGLMYRISDVEMFFNTIVSKYISGSFTVRVEVSDSFIPENEKSYCIDFGSGTVSQSGGYDVSLKIGIAELSSLAVCAVSLKSLVKYGLAEISDSSYLDRLDRVLAVSEKPVCLTHF